VLSPPPPKFVLVGAGAQIRHFVAVADEGMIEILGHALETLFFLRLLIVFVILLQLERKRLGRDDGVQAGGLRIVGVESDGAAPAPAVERTRVERKRVHERQLSGDLSTATELGRRAKTVAGRPRSSHRKS